MIITKCDLGEIEHNILADMELWPSGQGNDAVARLAYVNGVVDVIARIEEMIGEADG